MLYELLAHNRTALLTVNPTQGPLVPVYESTLVLLVERGFLRIVGGGPDTGTYLTERRGLAHVHVTDSSATFDAIVWGTGPKTRRRRRERRPLLKKPITPS